MSATLIDILDTGRTRGVAYLALAAVSLVLFVVERRLLGSDPSDEARERLWPSYWLLTMLVLVAMTIGRTDLIDFISDFGREQAASQGLYERRRPVQVVAVATISAAWLVFVVVAIWRVPPRRRRYLPNVIAVSAIAAFAAARLVSLHHVDTVLYRRDLGGVRIVAVCELALLSVAAATIAAVRWRADRPAAAPTPDAPPAGT